MFEEEMQKLLAKDWCEEEYKLINRLLENLKYYKRLMPKALKLDIISALELCNRLKIELEEMRATMATTNATEATEATEATDASPVRLADDE